MKLIKRAFIIVASLLLTCGIILAGCQLFNQEDSSPTSPDNTSQSTSYWGQTGIEGGKMAIFVPQDRESYFSVNVPANDRQKPAEGYVVWYSVYRTSDNKFHAYVVYSKALEEATVCIGILNGPPELAEGEYDLLEQVVISYASYHPDDLIHKQGPLELYAFPRRWAGWDRPKGEARVPAPDNPPDGEELYFFSEGKTSNTMENRCGSSDPELTTTTTTTSTTTTTTTTTTTMPLCPPPYTNDPDYEYIRICDDTADGSGPKVTEDAGCGSLVEGTFSTASGNRGVQVSVDSPDTFLGCIEWTTQSGTTWTSGSGVPVSDGESHTLEGPYNVAIECRCDAA